MKALDTYGVKIGERLQVAGAPFPYNLFWYRVTSVGADKIGLEIADPPKKD